MNGIYPCFYEENGVKKQFIATQFESHHAREVFTCIDEPEAKAVFTISITTRKTTVVSNTPVASTSVAGKLQTTTFEPTPLMSTYLVAFVVGDMAYKEAKTKRGVIFWGTVRNIQEIKKVKGFNGWILGTHPSSINEVMLTSINTPIFI